MKGGCLFSAALGLAAIAALVAVGIGGGGSGGTSERGTPVEAPADGGPVVIVLPDDPAHFPAGPGGELAEARCTACHSAEMVLNQPPMAADKWAGVVKKMRETYGAQVEEAEVPTLVAYLAGLGGGAAKATTTGGPADARGRPSSQTAER